MKHPYKTREGGATVTIFVPYDCKNHCPFCINKGEYADMTGFSLEKICRSIERMDAITPDCDFVFTGGEPFANLESLQVMLDKIPTTHKVYINTTLPVSEHQSEADILAFAERNRHKITCINVSRHMQHYVVESNDGLLSKLPVPFRVNCVLYENYPVDQLVPYLERFRKIPGASTMQEVPCNARTVRRPVMQNSASNWSGAPHTGTDRRGSCSGSGRENRQISTPGIPWLQRPVPEPCLNKYSFSMISHDLFLWVRNWFYLC